MKAQRLRAARLEAGFQSARQAALALGIPYSTYMGYEHGTREPDHGTLGRLADFYGVSADYLLGRNEEEMTVLTGKELPSSLRDRQISAVGVLKRSVRQGGLPPAVVSQLLMILQQDAQRKARPDPSR